MGKKNVYNKTIAITLIQLGHNLLHTMRNRNDPRWQIFVFEHTELLERDLAKLSNREYIPNYKHEQD